MNRTYPSDWTYADFGHQFRAELYGRLTSPTDSGGDCSSLALDPNQWADLFAASGAK